MVLPGIDAPILRPTVSGQISDLGRGGVVIVEPKLFRATWDNRLSEDLSRFVVSAGVSCDPSRDNTWVLDATITLEGWLALTPFLDWVAPVLTAFYPDGTVRTNQLGLYLVLDSGESREEIGGTVKLDARSPTWLLSAQGFTTKFRCPGGSNRMARVRAILDEAVLTGGDDSASSRRYMIPTHPKTFKNAKEWPRNINRLEVANEILTGTGFYPLWDNHKGELTTRRRGTERLIHREPVRVWHANVPVKKPLDLIDDRIHAVKTIASEVVGTLNTTPSSADQVNEILIVNDDPRSVRYYRKKRAKNKKNKRGRLTGRRGTGRGGDKAKRYTHPLIDDDATAEEVATGLLDELSTQNRTMTLTVLPDPTFVAIRETILLGIWDIAGRPIANGRYLVHRVQYGLTPENALMQIDVGEVEDIEDEDN